MTDKKSHAVWETAKTILYAVLIAVAIRSIAYEPFSIPSGSMIPSLLVGDYLFVSKFSYGYSRHSLPFSQPPIAGRILFSEPERGDVVVFKLPADNKTDYIKRIVGLPGDKLQVRGGVLNINGQPVQRERINDYIFRDESGNIRRAPRYNETLPNGRRHAIIEMDGDRSFSDETPVYTVPADHFFAMGDNRDSSQDSRFPRVGFVPKENLIGRAEILFFSIDGQAWKIWTWPWNVRFDRLFRRIE